MLINKKSPIGFQIKKKFEYILKVMQKLRLKFLKQRTKSKLKKDVATNLKINRKISLIQFAILYIQILSVSLISRSRFSLIRCLTFIYIPLLIKKYFQRVKLRLLDSNIESKSSNNFHMVNSVTCMNIGTSLKKAIKRVLNKL